MYQKTCFCRQLILAAAWLALSWSSRADILVVDQDEGPYTSIGAAVAAAGPTGDTISIEDNSPATYDEAITITKDLTIEDNSAYDVTLTNTIGTNQDAFFLVTGGAVVTLHNLYFHETDGMAVQASGATVDIEDCTFVGCDGDEQALSGTNGASIDVVNGGVVNLTGCDFDNTLSDLWHNGSIIAAMGIGTTVNATRCTFRNHRNPAGDDVDGRRSAAVTIFTDATGNFQECAWACDGNACLLVRGGNDLQEATATVNRCLLTPLLEDPSDTCDRIIHEKWGLGHLTITNTIIDASGTHTHSYTPGGENEACIWIDGESYVNINYCTILNSYNGIFGIGNPFELKVANSLIGRNTFWNLRWVHQAVYTWDLWLENNHFWGSPNHFPADGQYGITIHSDVGNTYDTAVFGGESPSETVYVPWNEVEDTVLDLGSSTLLGTTADDYDEEGVRPRGLGNDKGAQEMTGPTPIPLAGVRSWRILR